MLCQLHSAIHLSPSEIIKVRRPHFFEMIFSIILANVGRSEQKELKASFSLSLSCFFILKRGPIIREQDKNGQVRVALKNTVLPRVDTVEQRGVNAAFILKLRK